MPAQYFSVLGLSTDADSETITKRFRQLAMQHHPDRTGAAPSEAYLQLCEAYQQLKKRREPSQKLSTLAPAAHSSALGHSKERRTKTRGCRSQRRFVSVLESDFKGTKVSIKV